jgi:hypothetical protein
MEAVASKAVGAVGRSETENLRWASKVNLEKCSRSRQNADFLRFVPDE